MSTDAEMEAYGPASIYLRKPEKERIEAQAAPFDAKSAFFVTVPDEMYVKGKLTKREGGKATVETLAGQVGEWILYLEHLKYSPFKTLIDFLHQLSWDHDSERGWYSCPKYNLKHSPDKMCIFYFTSHSDCHCEGGWNPSHEPSKVW